MRIHHLNCSTTEPIGGSLIYRAPKTYLVSHCLLIETQMGLVLVNTGLGVQDILNPSMRLNPYYRRLFRPILNLQETALNQVLSLGFKASDVKHIILTHLDSDNIGGIEDFPEAQFHVMQAELEAALNPNDFISRLRYNPNKINNPALWNAYYAEGEKWFGFDSVKRLTGLPEEIVLVSMCGYSQGHAAVAVRTDQGWLLHAGNSYFFRGELNQDYNCPRGLRFFQRFIQVNRKMRLLNQIKLRDLAHIHHADIRIFCNHDPIEFEDLKNSTQSFLSPYSEEINNILWMRSKTITQTFHT